MADEDYRLYRELAAWWPLISPPAEYADDAAVITAVFDSAAVPVRSVLDLGSGGGNVAWQLRRRYSVTLVDRSPDMLAVSRQLNPDCVHVRADMRTLRTGQVFDAVLVHDAVDYITTRDDLRMVIETAFVHCRPGGVAVFAPDHTAETFRPGTGSGGGGSDAAGRQASFREKKTDPQPENDWILAEYEFTLREPDGTVRMVPETHRLGSFSRDTWLGLLTGAGFEASTEAGVDAGGGHPPRVLFVARRPGWRQGADSQSSTSGAPGGPLRSQ